MELPLTVHETRRQIVIDGAATAGTHSDNGAESAAAAVPTVPATQ